MNQSINKYKHNWQNYIKKNILVILENNDQTNLTIL